MNWGDVPTWIGTGSFFIAAIAYQQSVADKRRDQASKISAWIGITTEADTPKRILRITNTSDAAVYDLFVKPDHSDSIFLPELAAKDSRTFSLPGNPPSAEETKVSAGVRAFDWRRAAMDPTCERLDDHPADLRRGRPVRAAMEPAGRWPNDLPGEQRFAGHLGAAMEPVDSRPDEHSCSTGR